MSLALRECVMVARSFEANWPLFAALVVNALVWRGIIGLLVV